MDIKHKAAALNLMRVDHNIYWKHLSKLESMGTDTSKFKYYKTYNKEVMLYSDDYLNNNDIDTLLSKDKENENRFNPNIFKRIKNKYDLFILRMMIIFRV
jgi:hypothetical protein